MIKLKKGPVCLVYYAIKNKRQSKLEKQNEVPKEKDVPSQAALYLTSQ
ncbi:MAG: hypothetical protein ACFE8B_02230 [Candidatus Hermodarchaeota archaeon]